MLQYTYTDDNAQTQTATITEMKALSMPDHSTMLFTLSDAQNSIYTCSDSALQLQANNDGTYTLTNGDDTSYQFTADGYLAQMEDKYGNTESFTLDASGLIQSITDTANRTYTIGYTSGKITSVTDSSGRP
jgi:YD repeat-containing protein